MATDVQPQLVLVGAGGHGRVVLDALRHSALHSFAGFADDNPTGHSVEYARAHQIICSVKELESWISQGRDVAVHISIGDCQTRVRLAAKFAHAGATFATIVHPSATLSLESSVAAGCAVLAGAILNPGCVLGEHSIVNTGAIVEHDCVIGHGVHIAPRTVLCGSVYVGDMAFLGAGSTVIPGIRIGANAIVGAGSTVLHDVADNTVVAGSPARMIRKRAVP